MSQLPGYRGPRTGKDAEIARREIDHLRAEIVSLQRQVSPIGTIESVILTTAERAFFFDASGRGKTGMRFQGRAICNGSNGTPNLSSRFLRFSATTSGTTGGADSSAHTHDVTSNVALAAEAAHTHSIAHDHAAFTSGAESGHTHGAGTYLAAIITNYSEWFLKAVARSFTSTDKGPTSPTWGSNTTATSYAVAVEGTSGASSGHTHSIDPPAFTGNSGAGSSHNHTVTNAPVTSGAASATENRPAFYELVPVMRIA